MMRFGKSKYAALNTPQIIPECLEVLDPEILHAQWSAAEAIRRRQWRVRLNSLTLRIKRAILVAYQDSVSWVAKRTHSDEKRVRALSWIMSLVFALALVGFSEPGDDVYRGMRNIIRQQPVSGKIVVVGIDDRTWSNIDIYGSSRDSEARVINNLFKMGARRIFFDRIFSNRVSQKDNAAFLAALKAHPGQVYIGASFRADAHSQPLTWMMPDPSLRPYVGLSSIWIKIAAFQASYIVPTRPVGGGQSFDATSVVLTHAQGRVPAHYRPDFSYQARSVPSISYLDAYDNHVDPHLIRGHDVIIGDISSVNSGDMHYLIGQKFVPGVYYHVLGAETLMHGTPQEWGWSLFLFLGTCLALLQFYARSARLVLASWAAVFVLMVLLPFYLDHRLITVEYFPGLEMYLLAAWRANVLRRKAQAEKIDAMTGLRTKRALEALPPSRATLVALKIVNLSEIETIFRVRVDHLIMTEVARRISFGDTEFAVYLGEDVLYWFTPILPGSTLAHHFEGFQALLLSAIEIGGRRVDLRFAFGADSDIDRAMVSRISAARMSAERAAATGKLYSIYDPLGEAVLANELQMSGDLERAVREGEISVVYQPKHDIASGEICGVEALARWTHPLHGAIPPDLFIRVAERFGRIENLTGFILDRAIGDICALDSQISLAVNIAVPVLQSPILIPM
ncbi:MAG: EAL domain-containing protein, partial [Alphaproteobacteria bacterium]|nr:EAL domain-containing protein [Alphaproteobacteria bacterium]